MRVVEISGDPMLALEKFEDINKYIFYLNKKAMDEISSYSVKLSDNIPYFFVDKENSYVFFAEGGIDEEGNEFTDTYIGIKIISENEPLYKISGIYAQDLEYTSPKTGEEILLKRN